MPRIACLTPEELTAFHLGDLPEEALAKLAEHLENCPRCEAAAQALDGVSDPVMAAYRQSALRGPLPEAAAAPARVGEYEILEEIGRGGMGVVYRARHLRLQRIAALKMLLVGSFARRDDRTRFLAEAEAVARLQHPHIVQIYEVGEYAESADVPRPYFTLEFVDGGNLSSRLAGRPQPPGQAAAWLEALARAAHYAHLQGIVHRDLKPSNVLLTAEGQPKICDFGVAKLLTGSDLKTRSSMLVGTAEYMAPEQAAGHASVGPAADIYALGAILYTMLTGHPPFQGTSVFQTLEWLQRQEPMPPHRLQPDVPRDLETICLKCLEKEPGKRYSSAETLAEDVHRFRSGEPIQARPTSTMERAWKWAQRRPARAGLLALSLAVLFLGFPGALVLWLRAERAFREADGARNELESAVYADRITLADHAYQASDLRSAHVLLAQCNPEPGRPDPRDWEFHYLDRLCHAELLPDLVHGDKPDTWVYSLAFHPTGKYLISTASLPAGLVTGYGKNPADHIPGEAKVWDATTGNCLATLRKHPGGVRALAVSPDGNWLATGGADGSIQLYDANTFAPRSAMSLPYGGANGLAFSPDSRVLAISYHDALVMWDVAGAKPRHIVPSIHGQPLVALAFSPDGQRLLLGDTKKDGHSGPMVLDPQTGQPLEQHLPDVPLECAAFSADGRFLALALPKNSSIQIWDGHASKMIGMLLGHVNHVLALAFCPDGRLVSAADDRTVRVWDIETGQEQAQYRGHSLGVLSLAISRDGRRLASGDKNQTVKLWDLTRDPRGLAISYARHGERLGQLAFAPEGQGLLAVMDPPTLKPGVHCLDTWDYQTGELRERLKLKPGMPGDVLHRLFAFSGDSRRLAGVDWVDQHLLRIYDTASGAEINAFRTNQIEPTALALSADGSVLAYTGWALHNEARERVFRAECSVRDSGNGQELQVPILNPKQCVTELALSPDGKHLAGAVREVSGTGQELALSLKSTILIWDLTRAVGPRTLEGAFPSAVSCMVFSQDGSQVAAAGEDHSLRVWDVQSGKLAFAPLPESGRWTGLAFNPDGRRLAAAGVDGIVRLWDTAQGNELLTLQMLGLPSSGHYTFTARVAFSPDGGRLTANNWDGTITVWTATPWRKPGPIRGAAR